MARNILITRRHCLQDPAASLSGGGWRLPLVNILDRRPQYVAEAWNNIDLSNTRFDADLGYVRRVGLFFFANLRASPMGLLQLLAGTDPTFADNEYEILTTCWPGDGTEPFEANPWGELGLTHVYMPDEYERLLYPRFLVPPAVIDCRYIRVIIRDITASEPLRIGCFDACEVWEPAINFEYGWTDTGVDESDVRSVPFGSTYVTERSMRRRMSFGLPAIAEEELRGKAFGLRLIKGRSQPLCVVPFPDDTASLEKHSIYGQVSQDSQISNPYFARYALPFQVDQLV